MSARSPELDVVIVTWNSARHLGSCLSSLALASRAGFRLGDVVVVDNASADDTMQVAESFAARLPLTVVRLDANAGFAAACNIGCRESKADYLLFLNPDTRLSADSISAPVSRLERPDMREAAVCGVQLLDDHGRETHSAADFPTPGMLVARALGLPRLAPRIFPPSLLPPGLPRASGWVDQVVGAFFLVRRQAFAACGGFDERFFLYFEELDLSLRLARQGWKSYFLKEACAVHAGHGSSSQVKHLRLFHSLRSRLLYASKHYGPLHRAAVLAATCLVEPFVRVGAALVTLQPRQAAQTVTAYARLYASLCRAPARETATAKQRPQ